MVNWYSENTKFYDLSTTADENTVEVSFESGKKRTYLKNSSLRKKFSCSFLIWDRTDEVNFWTWYEETLLSGSETFSATNFLTQSGTKEYRMTSVPKVNDSQYPKECQIEVEEE